MSTFILVHGAFRGGWAWDRVAPLLRAEGHTVFAPSLTGCGERFTSTDATVTLADWVGDITAIIDANPSDDIVLVGHSQAGLVIAAAAEACRARDGGARAARLVFLDAPVPQPGERGVDCSGATSETALPPAEVWIPATPLARGDRLADADIAWINERLTPTPFRPSLDTVIEMPLAVPLRVVFCEHTPDGYPSRITRQRFDATGEPYVVLPTGHDAPIEAPELVFRLLHL